MMKRSGKKVVLRGERLVKLLIVFVIIAYPVITVFTKAKLSETNISVEQLKSKIARQEGVNESLSMQVDELASLDKVEKIASSQGLTYNNKNIKNIGE